MSSQAQLEEWGGCNSTTSASCLITILRDCYTVLLAVVHYQIFRKKKLNLQQINKVLAFGPPVALPIKVLHLYESNVLA